MGQDRNIAGSLQPKDEILQPRRQQMVRRLKQQVPGIVESQSPTLAQLDAEIGGDMHVCARDKGDRYPGLGNAFPESVNRDPDCRTGIVIDAREDMRGARNGS